MPIKQQLSLKNVSKMPLIWDGSPYFGSKAEV